MLILILTLILRNRSLRTFTKHICIKHTSRIRIWGHSTLSRTPSPQKQKQKRRQAGKAGLKRMTWFLVFCLFSFFFFFVTRTALYSTLTRLILHTHTQHNPLPKKHRQPFFCFVFTPPPRPPPPPFMHHVSYGAPHFYLFT